jgi:biotin-dependent carboxylase-like uncharacterized protein
MIEVLESRMPATFQDAGRPGYRHLGVPLSGALDVEWLAIANALAGNPPAAVALEAQLIGPRLRADAPVTIALAGEFSARIADAGGQWREAGNWRSHLLAAGEILDTGSLRSRVGYLAIHGGFDLPSVLGSRSTYVRAGFGGIDGRALATGDRLNVPQIENDARGMSLALRLPRPPGPHGGALRVVAGPQREYFTDAAWARMVGEEFTVGRAVDRMGLRLEGPRLDHDAMLGADIVSDGVTPGAIQVPGDGHPIVLLADCQTVGGYPKIATVIGADLPCLGHFMPGQTLRFVEVSVGQAIAARRQANAVLAERLAGIVPSEGGFDLEALYAANLIAGVIDAHQ